MTIWTCAECGATMRIKDDITPRMCCICGSENLSSPESTKRLETYAKYDQELAEITKELNSLYEQTKKLHDRYTYIMQYFRQQKRRKLITEEEYNTRADKFKYVQTGMRGKAGRKTKTN